MNTKILNANEDKSYAVCADIIANGGIVAFPTETVYGLGCNGLSGEAVKKIYAAKGRPQDNPLILHVESIEQAEMLYRDIPDEFYKLAGVFWPGPLTIICKKADIVPKEVTAGLDTVAVRMPADTNALRFIREVGVPIAAPSANLSGRPSPTTHEHVIADLQNRIDAILCAGSCKYGVESTVLSLVGSPIILRPGAVTPNMISSVIGEVTVSNSVLEPLVNGEKVLSPGMKYKHYAPDAKVVAFTGRADEIAQKICKEYDKNTLQSDEMKGCIIFASEENMHLYGNRRHIVLGSRKNAESMCGALFAALREYNDWALILCEGLDADEMGLAYMNRLLRSCGFTVC